MPRQMNILGPPEQVSQKVLRISAPVFATSLFLALAPRAEALALPAQHHGKHLAAHHQAIRHVALSGPYRLEKKPERPMFRHPTRFAAPAAVAGRPGQVAPAVVGAIHAAQRNVHADPDLLLAIASQESSLNSTARNRHSSARGLLQFTSATWLTVVRDFGPQDGLGHYAAAIRTGRDGRLSVDNPRLRRSILALRDDPLLQVTMTTQRLEQQRRALELRLGRPAVAADLYFLHLLGPTGATRFLTCLAEHPDASSVATVGSVAGINAGLFIKDGRPMTVAAAYSGVQTILDQQVSRNSGLFQPKSVAMTDAR